MRPSRLPPPIDDVAVCKADSPDVSDLAMVTGDLDLAVDVMYRDQVHLTTQIAGRLHRIPVVLETKPNIILRFYGIAEAEPAPADSLPEDENGLALPNAGPPR